MSNLSFRNSFILLTTAILVVSGFFVSAGTASAVGLGVTQITAVKTFATANGNYADGWSWVFDVTVPTNETTLNMKFADWVSGLNIIPAASNIRFYSAQSSNANGFDDSHKITISAANNFSDNMYLMPGSEGDLSVQLAGRQIQITIEVAVPDGSAGGSYSTSYGIQTNPTLPIITAPAEQEFEATGASTTPTLIPATATDIVDPNPVITYTPHSFSVGEDQDVIWTATDVLGNQVSTTSKVTIKDTTAPEITAPAEQEFEATGASTTPTLIPATATDIVDPNPVITYTPHSFSVGEDREVTWTATDSSNNVSTTTSKVTIIDTTKPTIIGTPADVTVESASGLSRVVTYTAPTATDLVDGTVAVTCLPTSGSTFPMGTTAVTCTATDTATNSVTTSFNVEVQDTTAPTLNVTGFTVDGTIDMAGDLANGYTLDTNNIASKDYLIQFKAGTSSDETLSPEYFGLTLKSSTVSAADLKAYYAARGVPELFLTYLNNAADGIKPFVYIDGSALKLVDAAKHDLISTDVDMTIPGNYPLGTYVVEGNIRDLVGNTTTITYTLIVSGDRIAPTATVSYSTTEPTNQDVIATITPSETVTITNNGGSDSYTFEENGSFTFEFADAAGNTGSVIATVGSIDRIAPVITIAPYNTDLTNQDVTVAASTNEGTLNSDSHIFTANGLFDFVATDAAGNVTTQTVTITNIDKIVPSITTYTFQVSGKDTSTDNNVFINSDNGVKIQINTSESSLFQISINGKMYWHTTTLSTSISRPTSCSYWKGTSNSCDGTVLADGVYTITVGITDAAGNSTTDTSKTITVDNTEPVIAGHDDVIQNVATHVGANVDYVLPTVTDADSTIVVSCSPISGSLFVYGETTVTCSASDTAGNQAIQTTFKISVIDNVFPALTVNGFTENGSPMPGTIADGFTLNTDNNPATHYLIQFASGSTASEDLKTEDVGLFLQPTGTQTADLQAYYSTNYPVAYEAYLKDAAAGVNPFAYIKAGGTTVQILDGAQKFLAVTETDMIVPGNYPLGIYTVKGAIHDLAGNATDVIYKLIVADKNAPVITLNGDGNNGDPTYVIIGESYAELGATATDDRDTVTVIPSGAVNTATIGTYIITYTATDLSLNTTTKTRTVRVISADQKITVSDSAGGSINAIAQSFTNPKYEFTSNAGYYIADVKVDGVSVKDQTGFVWITGNTVADYTFTNVTASHTLSAVFELMPAGDINKDGQVDAADLSILTNNLGRIDCVESGSFCNGADIDKNGQVDAADYIILKGAFGQ